MNPHAKNLGNDCIKRAKAKYGVGWSLVSEETQRGAIALEVASVLLNQVNDKHPGIVLQHCQDVARAALYPEA